MRLISIPMLVVLFLIALFSFGQQTTSGNKVESNRLFVKVKDASLERISYSNLNLETSVYAALDVNLKKIIDTYKITSIESAFKTTEKSDVRLRRVYTLTFPTSTQREAIMSALRQLSYLDYVETIPVYDLFLTPNDLNAQQWNLPKINATAAWDLSTGSGKVIAIVDDAVRLTHQDLAANIWSNPNEIANNGIDDDGNGYIDDINGYDVADNDNNPTVPTTATNSEFTHGTHCSGIAAAVSNNGIGIASIGYNNKIMAVKCKSSSDLGGSLPFAYSGLAYAIDAGADVISMSWGGYYYSATYQLLFNVAYDAGIICVAAAGNSNTDIPMYPASYNHVISVAATDQNDLRASFSNFGSTVDVSAPGVNIYSTLAGSNSAYGMLSGTSMACPLVSGLCALMLSYNPSLTPDQLEQCLKSSSDNIDNINSGFSGELGAGRINAYQTMLCLQTSPLVAFQSNKQLVCPGQTVVYTDMSSLGANTGVTWSWSFPGGVPSTSTLQNPTVVYNSNGNFSATLTVTNSFGNNSHTKTNYISVAALTAVLSGGASIPAGGNALLEVDFSNSTGPFTIQYTDGSTTKTISNITSTPYYFTVSPPQTSTYTLTSISTPACTGTFSGTAVVTIGALATTDCGGLSSVMFEKVYGNSTNNFGNNIIQSNTGENYLIGVHDVNASTANFTISKLNATWDIVSTKSIGTNASEYLYNSIKTTDGNIIICGTVPTSGGLDAYVVKVDFNGNIIWSQMYGGSRDEYAFSIQNTSDGGYILAGRTESFTSTIDAYIVKMDALGNVQWTKAFGRDNNDYAFTCLQTPDGGFITAAASQRSGFSNYDYLITKLTSTGSVSWSKYYGGNNDEGPRKLIITSDGGYLIGGHSRYRNTTTDAMITKLDASGNLIWSKTFGGNGEDDVFVVKESADGNYLVAGITTSNSIGGLLDIFFNKFDTNGNVLWSKLYGGAQIDYFPSMGNINNASDGGYTLVGTTFSAGFGGADMYLIKTDCNGNTGCSSKDATFLNYVYPPSLVSIILSLDMSAPGSISSTSFTLSGNLNLSANPFCISSGCMIDSDFYSSDTTICKGTTVTFTSTSTNATSYKWYVGNTLIGVTPTITNTFLIEGDYKIVLIADNGNCSDNDTLTIHVVGLPQLVVSDDVTICKTTSTNLLVSGASTYRWLNPIGLSCTTCTNPIATPLSTQYYYVEGTSVDGCISKDSIHVVVKCCVNGQVSPQAAFSLSDTTICVNSSVTITNLSYTSISNVSAEWDFGTAATPQFLNALQPTAITYTQSGRWPIKLIVTDDCGRDTIVNYINVFNPPVVDSYPDVYLCPQKNQEQFNITPISDFSYSWTPTLGLSNALIANPFVSIDDTSIVYKVLVKDNVTGCESDDYIKVSSHSGYQIQAMNDTAVVQGNDVTLTACCGAYTWTPSSFLTNPSAQNPVARLYHTSQYFVWSAPDSIGCIATDSVTINVIAHEPNIPNLITPNGDNLNDYFVVEYICPNSTLEIYNRWGTRIYKSDDYQNDWNGSNVSNGVYYISFVSGCTGKEYKSWLQVLGQ